MNGMYTAGLWLTIITTTACSNAQTHYGSAARGTANTSLTSIDTWSVLNNQAALAFLKNKSFAFSYDRPYALKELAVKSLSLIVPIRHAGIGISAVQTGYNLYRESKAGVSYGLQLDKRLSMGIQLVYEQLKLGEPYGSKNAVVASFGLLAKLSQRFILGAHIFNLNNAGVDLTPREYRPISQRLGIKYNFSELCKLICELDKEAGHVPNVKLAVTYEPSKLICLRTGINTFPVIYSFGFGTKSKYLHFDIAYSYHLVFGNLPSASIICFPFENEQ